MATLVTTSKVDDTDGVSEATQTVEFALDDTNFEIDLTDRNAQRLRDILAEFIAHARRVGKPPVRPHTKRLPPETARDVRVWVREHGGTVFDKGRLPDGYVQAYFANDPSLISR